MLILTYMRICINKLQQAACAASGVPFAASPPSHTTLPSSSIHHAPNHHATENGTSQISPCTSNGSSDESHQASENMRDVSGSNRAHVLAPVPNGMSHRPTYVVSSSGDYAPNVTQNVAVCDASRGPTPPRVMRVIPDYNPLCPLISVTESENRKKTAIRLHDEVEGFLAEVMPTDLSKNQRQEIVDKVSRWVRLV
jgi:hypothetical protein